MGFTLEQSQEIIKRRLQVVVNYCKKKGWEPNPDTLTIDQIMEIRSQDEWKNVPLLVSNGK